MEIPASLFLAGELPWITSVCPPAAVSGTWLSTQQHGERREGRTRASRWDCILGDCISGRLLEIKPEPLHCITSLAPFIFNLKFKKFCNRARTHDPLASVSQHTRIPHVQPSLVVLGVSPGSHEPSYVVPSSSVFRSIELSELSIASWL